MPPTITVSDVVCGGDKKIAMWLVEEYQLGGAELMPFRYTTLEYLRKLGGEITSLHGSPWANCRGLYYRLQYDKVCSWQLFALWEVMIGSLLSNPSISLARKLRKPIVLHQELVFDLEQSRKLDILKDVEVRVENSNFFGHPLVRGRGLEPMVAAYNILRNHGIVASITLDFEHMIEPGPWQGPRNFLDELCRGLDVIGDRKIAALHLCDTIPGNLRDWRGHLELGEGIVPLTQATRLVLERACNIELTIENATPIGVHLKLKGQERLDFYHRMIGRQVRFIQDAIS
ncbi:MAG: hypothetical protein NTZ65_02520 [Candidatus Berkelbacteria bacterium]|nr:hypothetical protein [Candidatus Berkelbacteria bacterium]